MLAELDLGIIPIDMAVRASCKSMESPASIAQAVCGAQCSILATSGTRRSMPEKGHHRLNRNVMTEVHSDGLDDGTVETLAV